MPRKEVIAKMPRTTIMRNLICPHCKLTNLNVEVHTGATIYINCIHCKTKMKWFEKIDPQMDEETSGEIIKLPPPKDEPEKSKEPEIKWA